VHGIYIVILYNTDHAEVTQVPMVETDKKSGWFRPRI